MRIIFCLLMLLPFVSRGQINRSASELAQENVGEYISHKLYKGLLYKPISYGELKSSKVRNTAIVWIIDHQFQIGEAQKKTGKGSASVQEPYRFLFYLDKKMKVVRAESIQF